MGSFIHRDSKSYIYLHKNSMIWLSSGKVYASHRSQLMDVQGLMEPVIQMPRSWLDKAMEIHGLSYVRWRYIKKTEIIEEYNMLKKQHSNKADDADISLLYITVNPSNITIQRIWRSLVFKSNLCYKFITLRRVLNLSCFQHTQLSVVHIFKWFNKI